MKLSSLLSSSLHFRSDLSQSHIFALNELSCVFVTNENMGLCLYMLCISIWIGWIRCYYIGLWINIMCEKGLWKKGADRKGLILRHYKIECVLRSSCCFAKRLFSNRRWPARAIVMKIESPSLVPGLPYLHTWSVGTGQSSSVELITVSIGPLNWTKSNNLSIAQLSQNYKS